MYQIESMRGNSQLKQAKKEELALIAEELLNEQKNMEELWEKMQIRKKDELSNRALGTNKATEKMLEDNVEKKRLDKKALKGLLWKNIANRIGGQLHSKYEFSGPKEGNSGIGGLFKSLNKVIGAATTSQQSRAGGNENMYNQLSSESYFNESLLKPSVNHMTSIEEEDEEIAAIDRTFTKNNPHQLNNMVPKEKLHEVVANAGPFKRHRIIKSHRYKKP